MNPKPPIVLGTVQNDNRIGIELTPLLHISGKVQNDNHNHTENELSHPPRPNLRGGSTENRNETFLPYLR